MLINPNLKNKFRGALCQYSRYLVLLCFFVSIFVVFGVPLMAQATTLYFLPQSQTIYQDNSFIVELRIDTGEQEINVVKAELIFPEDSLEFIEFNKGGSILILWPEEPEISDNKISFIGGLPSGFKGQGLLARIIFKTKKVSQAKIDFIKENCHILLNDGKGTADSLIFLEADYQIIKKPENLIKISSSSHPDQYRWSRSNTLYLHWDLIEGAEYSYLLSQDPLAQPDNIADQPEGDLLWVGDMEYANLDDNIYYFTLKEKLPNKDWSETVSYRAMIDATAPEEFDLKIGQEPAMFEGKYFLSFNTTDKTSGIAYYEIKEGKGEFKKAVSPYVLEDQNLRSKIVARAVDQAGNERTAEYLPPEKPLPWQIIILILIGAGIILWIVKKSKIKNEKNSFSPIFFNF